MNIINFGSAFFLTLTYRLKGGCHNFQYFDHNLGLVGKCLKKYFFDFKKSQEFLLNFFRIKILLHFGVPDNQILLYFSVPDIQILLRFGVTDN